MTAFDILKILSLFGGGSRSKNKTKQKLSHASIQSGLERIKTGSSVHLCWEVVPVDYGSGKYECFPAAGGIVVSFFVSDLLWGGIACQHRLD